MRNHLPPPEVRELTDIKFPRIDSISLHNGIRLNILPRTDINVVRIVVAMKGGTAESVNPAVAMLSSLLQFDGTSTMKGSVIADRLSIAGAFTQCTAKEHTRLLSCVCLYDHLPGILPILTDIVENPVFPDFEFKAAQKRLALQLLTQEQSVNFHAENLSSILTFGPSHPYSVILDDEAIDSITAEDVRKFYDRYNNPGNFEIYFAGNLTDEIEKAINETFGKLSGHDSTPSDLNVQRWNPSPAPIEEWFTMEGKLQSAIVATIPLIDLNTADFFKLRLAVIALGGYFGSRLQQNIREDKGWTYGVSATIRSFFENKLFALRTDCDNQYVEPVIREMAKEMFRLGECRMPEEELLRVRRAETSTLAEIVSTPFTALEFYINTRLQNLPSTYFADRLNSALNITPEQIRKMAKYYLDPDHLLTAIAGLPSKYPTEHT